MDYRFVAVPFLLILLSSVATSIPVAPKGIEEETVAVYVPYDVKYVPVEVPDKFLNVEPLNSKPSDALEPIVLKKEDILKHFNGEGVAIKPISTNETVLFQNNNEGLVVVPLATISDALKTRAELKSVEIAEPKGDLVALPLTAQEVTKNKADYEQYKDEEESGNHPHHRVSKRQASRFPFYRPVIRFTRLSSSRRRLGGPSRNPAMVGYLSDRDYFPTVA